MSANTRKAHDYGGSVRPPAGEQLDSAPRVTDATRSDAVRAIASRVKAGALTVEEAGTVLDHLGLLPRPEKAHLAVPCPRCSARAGAACRNGINEMYAVHRARQIEVAGQLHLPHGGSLDSCTRGQCVDARAVLWPAPRVPATSGPDHPDQKLAEKEHIEDVDAFLLECRESLEVDRG